MPGGAMRCPAFFLPMIFLGRYRADGSLPFMKHQSLHIPKMPKK